MSSDIEWDESQPIYLQLRERIIALIIEGVFKEGEAIPSVRQVSTDYRINHLTVSKAYQELVDEGLLQKRRGLGMFVAEGAQQQLLGKERDKFLQVDMPLILERVKRLGISEKDFIDLISKNNTDSKE